LQGKVNLFSSPLIDSGLLSLSSCLNGIEKTKNWNTYDKEFITVYTCYLDGKKEQIPASTNFQKTYKKRGII
jgi:hypothetical protein